MRSGQDEELRQLKDSEQRECDCSENVPASRQLKCSAMSHVCFLS